MLSACIFSLSLLLLPACDWTPKNVVLIKLESKNSFLRASLTNNEVEPRIHLQLKWVDDNTWQTTVGLPAGRYIFVARSTDGRYYQHPLDYEPELRRYTLPAESKTISEDSTDGPGPLLTFQVMGADRHLNGRTAFVIANGERAIVLRAPIANSRFQVRLPEPGNYRLMILAPGDPPAEALYPPEPITADRDYGFVPFKSLLP
jgi:hypothetical protein